VVGCVVAAATVAGVPDSDGVGLLVYATTLGGYFLTGSFASGCRRRRWASASIDAPRNLTVGCTSYDERRIVSSTE
jgi:hypothetical protein